MPVSVAAGSGSLGFSYRVADTLVTRLWVSVNVYAAASCGGSATARFVNLVPTTDGVWHDFVPSTVTVPAGQSLKMGLQFDCINLCTPQVNFDDLVFDQPPPTAVTVRQVTAIRTARGVAIRWSTASEGNSLGFNLYRQQNGNLVKLNRTLIPSVFGGTTTGHDYSWLDRGALARGIVRYRVQAVGLNGKRSWVGSATTD